MSERIFILLLGLAILAGVYFEQNSVIYALSLMLILESITDIRLTRLFTQLTKKPAPDDDLYLNQRKLRFDVDSQRVWRSSVALVLSSSSILLNEYRFDALWFFPWFLGFALTGAGISGICPVLLAIRKLGFR